MTAAQRQIIADHIAAGETFAAHTHLIAQQEGCGYEGIKFKAWLEGVEGFDRRVAIFNAEASA